MLEHILMNNEIANSYFTKVITEFPDTGAAELAKKIRQKEASSLEIMQAHLELIERVNPQVNAIVTFLPELALENAKKADEKISKGIKYY